MHYAEQKQLVKDIIDSTGSAKLVTNKPYIKQAFPLLLQYKEKLPGSEYIA